MNNVFFIGDTHFGHKNILKYTRSQFATIEEHNETLVENWNKVVKPGDTVWHLGDFCFGRPSLWYAGRLNGIKRLVLGNHDTLRPEEYMQHFASIHGAVKLKNMVLTHIPVHPQQKGRYPANIHGHLHAHRVMVPNVPMSDLWYINVSCEQIDHTPIPYESLPLP